MSALLLAVALLTGQDPVGKADTERKDLEKYLQSYASAESVSLFIDLPKEVKSMRVARPKQGMWSMIYLSAMLQREWRSTEQVQVFARRQRTQPSLAMDAQLDVLQILNKLSDDDLEQAMGEGINFGKLAPQDRAKILGRSYNWPGLTQTSLYDFPEETFEAFQDPASRTRLQLKGLHKYVATGPNGKRVEAYSSSSIDFNTDHSPYAEPRPVTQDSISLEPAPADGELDFSKGEIVTVRELLTRASVTFKRQYRVDERTFENEIFVCGKFTRERFEACSKVVLALEPFRTVELSDELETLRKLLADRMQRLNANMLPERGKRYTLQELEVRDPMAFAALQKSGVGLSTSSVVIEPGFLLWLDPGVRKYLGSTNREYNGVTRSVTEHRQIAIGLGF